MRARLVVLWLALAIPVRLAMADWFKPETFSGALFVSVVGTLIAGSIAWLSWQAWSHVYARTRMKGRFSDLPLQDVAYAPFGGSPNLRIQAGDQIIRFGLQAAEDLPLLSLSVRFIERTWLPWRYRNLTEPMPVALTKVSCEQIDLKQRGYWVDATFNGWHDGNGGFKFQIRGDSFLLEKGTSVWFEFHVAAKRAWAGFLSARGSVRGGGNLYCRCKFTVVDDAPKPS